MANEAVFKYGTQKVLANGTGAATSNNQLSTAASITYSQSDTLDYPDAIFTLVTAGFGGAPTSGTTVDVYLRPIDIDGSSDQPAPPTGASTAAYKGKYATSFVLHASSSSGDVYEAIAYDIPRSAEAYLFNNGTGQTLSANWTLKIRPRTLGPA
jgi:hypothetical protein